MKKFRALVIAVLLGAGWVFAQQPPSVPLKGSYEIQAGGSARKYDLATDEVSVKDPAGRRKLKKVPAQDGAGTLSFIRAERAKSKAEVSPVLYEQGKPHSEFTRAHVTGRVLVKLAPGIRATDIASAAGLRINDAPSYAPDLAVLEAGSGEEALSAMEKLRTMAGVVSADVLLAVQKQKKAAVNDPLYAEQWHLHNAGQRGGALWIDLNVEPAWSAGFDGTGVTIGIVDDGLQYTHPDLQPNYNASLSFDFNGNDSDPMPELIDDDGNPLTPMVISPHGTACAGLAAARGNNNIGVTGVAYMAGLAGIRLLGAAKTDQDEADAFNYRNDAIQIKSNSWGEPDDGYTVGGPGLLAKAALIDGVTNGRGGKGTIYIFPGGNGLANQDNSNYDGYANAVQVIAVGAINDYGFQSYYGEPGANIAVVAPASGGYHNRHITTTDLIGEDGYNNTAAGANDLADRDYTNSFGGTSAVCPQVAGVVALMLQANPNLGWRDVKEILMRTARPVHSSDSDWLTNGAGLHFSHTYGAGLVDAGAAVALAQNWINLTAEITAQLPASQPAATAIPDNNATGITRTYNFTNTNFRVEHVEVTVDITHPCRGDLEIVLTSPSGMTSRLAEQHSPDSPRANYSNWTFSTVRHWGENATGNWTVKVADREGNSPSGTLNSVVVKLHGSTVSGARIAGSSAALVAGSESNLPANSAADPGETVSFNLGLKNIGSANTLSTFTATLLPIGGVSNPSATQTYGALTAGGAEVKKSFTFQTDGSCGTMVKAVLQLQNGATRLGYASVAIPLGKTTINQQSSLGGTITINDAALAPDGIHSIPANATPSPSVVTVAGLTGRVQNMTVLLTNLTHGYPDDMGMLLQGPSALEIKFFNGGPTVADTNVSYTFSDNASIYMPFGGTVPTGTYKVFDEYGDILPLDPNVEPAFTLGEFNGLPANGSWNLFAADFSHLSAGSIASWRLNFTTVDCTDNVLFAQAATSVGENVGLCPVVVRRTGGREGTATVNYATTNGTALAGSDYTATSGTLTFLPGELERTILVPITDDLVAEPNQTFTVTLSSPTGNTQLGSLTTDTVTITTNLAITSASQLAGGSVGAAYSQSLAATGGTPAYSWTLSAGTLPTGLTLSSAGVLSGSPTDPGTYNFTVQVADAATVSGSDMLAVSLTVAPAPTITTASLPGGTASTAYSQTLTESGGTAPYSWTLNSGTLPPGLTLSTAGLLSGTPTTAGAYSPVIKLTDAAGAITTKSLPVTIAAALVITTTTPLPGGTVGSAYSQTMAATGGTGARTWSVSTGALPAGLTLSSAGVLSGTPAASGTFNFTLQVTDTIGAVASKAVALTITPTLAITTTSPLPGGTVGTVYSRTFAATGGTPAYTWTVSAGTLPTGLTLTTAGVLSGTPTVAGTSNFTVKVTDSLTANTTLAVALTIAPTPTITTASLPGGTVGAPYSQTLAETGGTSPYSWTVSVGTLPAGLTLSSAGVLSGLPTTAGTTSFTVKMTDAAGAAPTKALSVTIAPALVITTGTPLPGGTMGTAYSQTMAATGGTGSLAWSVTGGALPGGLSLSGAGVLNGTPTASGTFNFIVQVTDSASASATKALALTITPTLTITTTGPLPGGTAGTAYSQSMTATGGTPAYAWTVSTGTLPTGLTLTTAGVLSGSPSAAGTFNFTVRVTDGVAATTTKALSATIAPALAITTTTPLQGGTVGGAYTQTIVATGGTGTLTWSLSAGTLPGGVTLSSAGALSGTPTASGTFNFTVQVTDAVGASTTKALALTITPTLSITTASPLPGGTVGTVYSQSMTATGGTPAYTWSVSAGTLPTGLTLSGAGLLSGTPSASGTFNFTVQADDSAGASRTMDLSLTITPTLTITTASPLAGGTVGAAYSQALDGTGGTPAFSWGVSAGSLPGGMTLSSAGVLSGTPTASGTFNFTVQATDSAPVSASATKALALTIAPEMVVTTGTPLPAGTVGSAFSATLAATGGTGTQTWLVCAGNVPPGLILSNAGGLNGTPTTSGTFNFTVQVTDAAAASTTKAMAVTINDATTPVVLSPASATVSEGGSVTFTVSRTTGATAGTVAYATSDGTATAGSDYTGTSGVLTFAVNELSKTFDVPALFDGLSEPDETFTVGLSSPTGGISLGGSTTATVTITDVPATPVDIAPASLVVTEADTQLTFTVSRADGATAGAVAFATANGSATAGSDYTATSGTLTFAANELSKTFNVQILDDDVYEPNENFTVTLSNPSGGLTLGAATVSTITIHDGDADGDGLPDDYETAHGLNPHNPADAALDSDGDGYTNLQEFIMGTDPRDPASRFAFTVTRSGNDIKIAFPTVTGRTYTVESSSTPNPPWIPVQANITGTDSPVTVTDTNGALQTRCFYHVTVQLQ